jgi:EAL and modified HD-GYP domain-containing signal transduction protein
LSGLSRRVTTLDEAIAVLGYDALYRWLALAMFQLDKSGSRDESLMLVALARAAFLEGLCPESDAKKGGELFLVGLFSLIDSLLKMPIDKIIASMYLSEDVTSVLLRREGPYARYLELAVAMEHGRVTQALSLCAAIGISTEKLVSCYRQSRTWAASDARP